MDYDITRFTFLADPLSYQTSLDELCVYLPVDLSSIEMLVKSLGESTGCSTQLDITWWNTLSHVLRYRSDWKSSPPRITLIHRDLPQLADFPHRWWEQQNYLRLLLEIMDEVQEKDGKQTDPFQHCELTVVFPTRVYEELQAALFHLPVWQVSIGFSDFMDIPIVGEWSTSWPTVLRYLHLLDGLMAQTCTLEREDVGTLLICYRKADAAYYIEYQGPAYRIHEEVFAQVEENPEEFTGLSFAQMHEVVKTFFTTGQRSSSVRWSLCNHWMGELQKKRMGEEDPLIAREERLPGHTGMIRETIYEGICDAVGEIGEQAFQLSYWKAQLNRQNVSTSRHLTALCIIGLSDLPEATELLHPFLRSFEKRERWVSATMLGRQQEEEALPILLSMLTDELPLQRPDGKAYDSWYDCWRLYAPRLLREWQGLDKDISLSLREALHLWIQSETLFDSEFDVWKCCEEALCYELGYWGNLAVLEEITLDDKRRKKLQMEIKRGNTYRKSFSFFNQTV